jgi:hypothetical protein
MEEERKYKKFWQESPKERDHSKERGIDGVRMSLRQIGWGMWSGFSLLRVGVGSGFL